ncbi:hypothetical protein ZIOFF_066038 [Zingiber officinale]|uniref:Uncharacterized protein n=1 Tax=Zingiber officinale TaxID=94328 RepID=A0A8J5K939_ZINOF|nr:hypothetical protein ZIOFF_066038 [Zingiber officinale]
MLEFTRRLSSLTVRSDERISRHGAMLAGEDVAHTPLGRKKGRSKASLAEATDERPSKVSRRCSQQSQPELAGLRNESNCGVGQWEERLRREMLEGKAVILDTDMPLKMQLHAMSSAYAALDLFDVLECSDIAAHIKNVSSSSSSFSSNLLNNFGCFFTHSTGTFIYFCLERLKFLVFKVAVAKTVNQSESEK